MYKQKLLKLKIPADIKGFRYLNQAIQIYSPDIRIMELYDLIASRNNDTVCSVERAIRHAISRTGIKMTNGNFIATHKILWSK